MKIDLLIALLAVVSLLIAVISWGIFVLFSMRRIERAIAAEGKRRPCPWDPIGGRAYWYSLHFFLPTRFFDNGGNEITTKDLYRYTKPVDRLLSWLLLLSTYTVVGVIAIDQIFGLTDF